MPHAVLWMSALSISHCVCNSASGNWIAWLLASGWPNGALVLAYATERSMQEGATRTAAMTSPAR